MNCIGWLGNEREISNKCSVLFCDKSKIFISADLFTIFCPPCKKIPAIRDGRICHRTSLQKFSSTTTAGPFCGSTCTNGPTYSSTYTDGTSRHEVSNNCSVTIRYEGITFIRANPFVILYPRNETIPAFGGGRKCYGTSLLIFPCTIDGPTCNNRSTDDIGGF